MASATTVPPLPPELHLEDKWKMLKRVGSRSSPWSSSCSSSTSLPTKNNSSSSSTSNPAKSNSSQRRCPFIGKCAKLAKEQRARFYIMKRCVTILICWHQYADS
ncbi:hypothetical protein NMG60_11018488 [Bertholletia excelsa]